MKRVAAYILFVSLLSFFFTGCTSDYYYAGSFLRKFDYGKDNATERVYVKLPTALIHTNSSLNDVVGFGYLPEEWQDSIIAAKTAILNRVDDSIFLAQFSNTFLFILSRTKIPIIIVGPDAKLPVADDQHFTVDFVQMELEEYLEKTRSDFRTLRGSYYAYDYELRHIAANVWLRIDDNDTNGYVYFTSDDVRDEFYGTVTSIVDGTATMKTDFDRLDVNDAYALARRLGYECARMYVEKILAEYVCRTKGTNSTYFIYDPRTNSIDDIMPYEQGMRYSFEKL